MWSFWREIESMIDEKIRLFLKDLPPTEVRTEIWYIEPPTRNVQEEPIIV